MSEARRVVLDSWIVVSAFRSRRGASSRLLGLVGRVAGEDGTVSKATYPLKLPASIKSAAERLAKEDGVSLNQWISAAVAQKVGAVETAAAFLRRRGERARPGDLEAMLSRAPDRAPDPGDDVPESWRP